ncbi:MAG TPA: endonuclease III [Firmicutes bacterium]|nr:endonuclease III [Bacillota bacterium]
MTDYKKYIGEFGTRARIKALEKKLAKEYGPFKPKPLRDPLDELILTVLSQNTNDRNSFRAFENMKEHFRSWDDVAGAPAKKLENIIRVGGLANSKSKYIKGILRAIKEQHGDYKLNHLKNMPVKDALDELTSLPGVGIKTASCVLLFSFGKPSMPVDTHVGRLARRLGLAVKNATADQIYDVLMALTPEELIYPFHLYLIRHGRVVCKSQRPQCSICVISKLCPSRIQ